MDIVFHIAGVFEPWHILTLLLGVSGGLILGATPGISPTLSVALLIPFTFHMGATTSLILLGAVYAASIAGGAISAILINVPGAPANIATTFDGYPMSQKGQSENALRTAFTSTLIGGVVGMLVLIFLAPVFVNFALQFGPAQMFWVAVLGITTMATLGSGSLLKGMLAGAFGVWLSTIGISPATGESRFVFVDALQGGIHVVVALIALFAIPQVFTLLESSSSQYAQTTGASEAPKLWQVIGRTVKERTALTVGAISGVIIGIIPGAGGQVASIIGYDQTRKLSKNNEGFGTGDVRGVIGSETANSAMVGPSLIPLLSLGLPGSPTCAVLLGGLLIHGIFPGPQLFATSGDIIWVFLGALLLGQVAIFGLGLWLARAGHFIARVPNYYLAAGILLLSVVGTYSIQHNTGDVLIMAVLGLLMFLAMKVGFEPAPVVLGVVLGPIAEQNFQMGRTISSALDGPLAYFTSGPLTLSLMALCAVSIGYGAISQWRNKSVVPRTVQEGV
jgi:putative tricarboxylic transport membrane protein